ncbi:hypothetical protein SA2016_0846 [Sinomonas atrocyanea]|uniref:Uncharacterized protein n=1 Tax=Sinomonas atrocyanea TaxID=37927 RepID=A0A126ZY91_9MICC|nr:hypothetical protein [Sinomonas atrocyanea]AMM31534.1 hypothetical protein SA2016_0846 [Sinomonas atrocyanea]GEB66035.1 hypothetical protein SAT01_34830 [Sinomonas atrocyanea]GGG63432.1 hypothetical protein GCM10007172_13370 [Sinomonas atrocyanea]
MKKVLPLAIVLAVLLGWMNWGKIGPVLGAQPGPAATAAAGATMLGAPATGAPSAVPAPTPGGAPSTAPSGGTSLEDLPPQRLRYVLIDPTSSTDKSFRDSMKADIIADVQNYVPPKPSNPKTGVPPVTGLRLTVRLVATNSLAYGQQDIDVSIPSVPGLPARPDMTADGTLDPGGAYDAFKKSAAAWSAAYDSAVTAAAGAAKALGKLDLNSNQSSGITAGAAALALLAPAQGEIQFAVLSDLDENRPQEPADFKGHPILVVQPDPVGDISRWDSLFNNFSSWASAGHAGAITRVRPEVAASALSTFITGK